MSMPDLGDLHEEWSGEKYTVLFVPKVRKRLIKADAQSRFRICGLIKRYADVGESVFLETQLKFEGRFKSGRPGMEKIAVHAFKANQLRIYGGLVPNTSFFLCCAIDVKKQNGANQQLLEATARTIAQYANMESL